LALSINAIAGVNRRTAGDCGDEGGWTVESAASLLRASPSRGAMPRHKRRQTGDLVPDARKEYSGLDHGRIVVCPF